MVFIDLYNYITNKHVGVDALIVVWLFALFFCYASLTSNSAAPPFELEFSESFRHEIDAYDIFKKCNDKYGTKFITNSVVFSCHSIEFDNSLHQSVSAMMYITFFSSLGTLAYTSYRLFLKITEEEKKEKKALLP